MIAPGWIYQNEMDLHLKYMKGSILEGGCAAGRLFSYLNQHCPNAEYVGVNTWTDDDVYLQKDWDKGYFDKGNLTELITKEMFISNCPYATAYDCKFEMFETDKKFDIVSIGQIGKNINWEETYKKAFSLCKDNGVVIGRNIEHKKYGADIRQAINKYTFVEQVKQAFVLRK